MQRLVSAAIALTVAGAVAGLLAGHPGPALRGALVALPLGVVATSVLARTGGGVAKRRRPLTACGIVAYGATAVADTAGAALTARLTLAGDLGLLFQVAVAASATRTWRRQMPGGLGLLPLEAAIAGLAAAALGDWLILGPYTQVTATRVLYANADLFTAGFIVAAGVVLSWPPLGFWLLAAAGMTVLGIADAVFASQLHAGHTQPSRLVMVAWPVGVAALGAAQRAQRTASRPAPSLASIALPTIAAGAALPVVIVRPPQSAGGMLGAAALVLAGVRLCISLVENLRLLAAARESARRQQALAELGRRALAEAPVEELISDAMQAAFELLRANAAAHVEILPDHTARLRATLGWPETARLQVTSAPLPAAATTMVAVRTEDPVVVEDWRTETSYVPTPLVEGAGVRSSLAVAIPRTGHHTFVLSVHSRRPGAFREAECAFLQSLANVLATADQRLATDAEIRDLAAARGSLVVEVLRSEQRERQRISEALHDSALQELLSAGQDLDDARDGQTRATAEFVERARAGVARAARDLRDAVTELHPVVLEHAGLGPALDAVAQRQSARSGFEYEIEVDALAASGHEEVLLSLTRELLTNVARHARAHHVRVSLRAEADQVVLEVSDDGQGIDQTQLAETAGHVGLASWTTRLEALGGTLSVRGKEGGGGTVARATLPAAPPP